MKILFHLSLISNVVSLQLPNGWEDVRVTVERDGPIDPDGPCANTRPEDDMKHVTLTAGWLFSFLPLKLKFSYFVQFFMTILNK